MAKEKKQSLRDRIQRRNMFRVKSTGQVVHKVQIGGMATLQAAAEAIADNAFEEATNQDRSGKSINEVTADLTDQLLAGDTDAVEDKEKRSTERAEEVTKSKVRAAEIDIEEPDEEEKAVIEHRRQTGISRINHLNQAYQSARAFCMNEGVVDESNDPEFNDDDPLDYLCVLCFEDAATDAVSCSSQITGCNRWFHLNCLGLLDGGPEFEWVCMDCANHNLVLDKKCGIAGVELTDEILAAQPVDDSDEEQGVIGNDVDKECGDNDSKSDEDYDPDETADNEDSCSEDDATVAEPSPSRKKPARKKPARKKDQSSASAPKTKRTKVSDEEDIFDGDDDIEICEVKVEDDEEVKPTARSAGANPTTAKQQLDIEVRKKIRAVRKPMEILQSTSTPFTRTDAYDPDKHVDAPVAKESLFPWNVHGTFYFGNQQPNEEGSKDVGVFNRPVMYLCAGSKANAMYIADHFREEKRKLAEHGQVLGFKVKIIVGYESYEQVFRSEKCKKKVPPPRPEYNKKSTIKLS